MKSKGKLLQMIYKELLHKKIDILCTFYCVWLRDQIIKASAYEVDNLFRYTLTQIIGMSELVLIWLSLSTKLCINIFVILIRVGVHCYPLNSTPNLAGHSKLPSELVHLRLTSDNYNNLRKSECNYVLNVSLEGLKMLKCLMVTRCKFILRLVGSKRLVQV